MLLDTEPLSAGVHMRTLRGLWACLLDFLTVTYVTCVLIAVEKPGAYNLGAAFLERWNSLVVNARVTYSRHTRINHAQRPKLGCYASSWKCTDGKAVKRHN